ncbi:MAG: Rne/Rng family ribonuclease, partial [Thermoleophilia bacterium]
GARRRRRKTAPVETAGAEGPAEAPAAAGGVGAKAEETVSEAVEPSAGAEAAQALEAGEPKAGKRRGKRGGRRRKTAAAPEETAEEPEAPVREATVADQAPASPEAVAGEESDAETGTTRKGRGRRRDRFARPAPTVPPEIPGYKEILVSTDAEELRVALVEDGRLAEIYFERPGKRSYAGNIYRGKAESVLAGMDASFIDIGLDRNGFLYVDDIADPEDGSKRPHKITQMLKAGQEIVVQVNKDPMGSKGARLTGKLSLAGRYLVYVPGGSGVGVSRRLGQDERDRLRDICKSLKVKNAGLIVRTVAEGKDVDELKRDLQYLSRLWTRLKKKADTIKAPGLVYEEADVSLQVARDLFNETFSQVIVDDAKQKDRLVQYLKKTAPELADRVKLHDGEAPLFKAHGIDEQISRALERRVPLPSGGNLVIDHTEALTVIDVNTGRFTGGKGLEDTITRNNLEAAREVVRQLRLRDIGGIIIIDFIDMEHPKNRDAVLNKLQAELETDRTKTYVAEISPLGLVEMTRQNITDGARGILTQTCPVCEGKARIPSAETVALSIERRLLEHSGRSGAKALLIEVNAAVADRMAASGRAKRIEKATRKRVYFEGSRQLPIDTFRIVAEGTEAAVEAHRIPVREEQEFTVELEYGLTYSPGDAVAHVDGYQLVVLNGRRHLGEKKKVKVVTTTRAGGIAALAG